MFGIYDVDTGELLEAEFPSREAAEDAAFEYTLRGELVVVERQKRSD